MSMHINGDEIEMGYPLEEEPLRNAIVENEELISEASTDEVEERERKYLSKTTYDAIKHNKSKSFWREIGDEILMQSNPMGNGVLHLAALHGNETCMDHLLQQNSVWIDEKNENHDTALHVAARAGHISILEKLLCYILQSRLPLSYSDYPKMGLEEILLENKQGNTFFHEALLNGHKEVINKILDCQELLKLKKAAPGFVELFARVALFWTNNDGKSVLHLAIERGYKDVVDRALTELTSDHPTLDELIQNEELAETIPREPDLPLDNNHGYRMGMVDMKIRDRWIQWSENVVQDSAIDESTEDDKKSTKMIPYGPYYVPPGKSYIVLAILKQNQDIMRIILKKKQKWIFLRDKEGRTALHYAASIGYLNGVNELLESCISCHVDRDSYGLFPIHLASARGHVEVVKKLLEHYPDPKEIVDNYGRNILHIAAEMGKLNVVRYILQNNNANHCELVKMINYKDTNGNTPLHLATLHYHPKIVHALTQDKRVDLSSVNKNNQSALDVCMHFMQENPSLSQRLTWIALESAGVKYASVGYQSVKVHPPSQSVSKQKDLNMDLYKDRINTLMLVSTLIITATFAAGFTLPGGTNSSDPEIGMALMLHHVWFKLFVFCITISMYGAISVTIILIWAQLGDITLALYALKIARPLLGVTLATLSVAFMAGLHLVISDLSWLATTFLVLSVISILMVLLLYTVLWLPSSSSNPVIRYISHYPFQLLTWLVERDEAKVAISERESEMDMLKKEKTNIPADRVAALEVQVQFVTTELEKSKAELKEAKGQMVDEFLAGFQSAIEQVKIVVPDIDLSTTGAYKEIVDGQIVEAAA